MPDRLENAFCTLETAKACLESRHYRDSINRCYYATFYAVKAILALEKTDFKRHKDVIGYFNKEYMATEIFPKDMGKKLGRLKTKREESDYDDFYIASAEEAQEQMEVTEYIVSHVVDYLERNHMNNEKIYWEEKH